MYIEEQELIDLLLKLTESFTKEWSSSTKDFGSSLVPFRGMLMLLSKKKLQDFHWSKVLESVTKLLIDATKEERCQNKQTFYEDFMSQNIDTARFLSLVQVIQVNIAVSIMSNVFSGVSIEYAVRLLDIFNDANKKRATPID
jgi:hypothetical protein